MLKLFASLALAFIFLLLPSQSQPVDINPLELDEQFMKLTLAAAELSRLTYEYKPQKISVTDNYEFFQFFEDEPDQAIVAKVDGYCIGAFRGTDGLDLWDNIQNFDQRPVDICVEGDCCTTTEGFLSTWNNGYRSQFEMAMRECAETCSNPDECVVFTGLSQGGATALIASILMRDYVTTKYIITFGQPAAIKLPCSLVDPSQVYRFINTWFDDTWVDLETGLGFGIGLHYDFVPMLPGPIADHFGHMFLLLDDPETGPQAKYLGMDFEDTFLPELTPIHVLDAHSHTVYYQQIQALMREGGYPISTRGYATGSVCTQNAECLSGDCSAYDIFNSRCVGTECSNDMDCGTGHICSLPEGSCIGNECYMNDDCDTLLRCSDNNMCVDSLGACEQCMEASDCLSGECVNGRCGNTMTAVGALLENNCPCFEDSNCQSGRCEGALLAREGTCEAALGLGQRCNSNSDCRSSICAFWFVCM